MLNTHFEETLKMCNALTISINDNNINDTSNRIARTKTKKRGTGKQQQQQKPIRKLLPADFTPKSSDILCGRGNVYSGHEGNQYFGGLVRSNLRKYVEASSRSEKIRVVDEIHREIKTSGVRFAKVDSETQRWYELNDVQAHQKIGHAIRDTIRLLEKDRPKRNATNNNNNKNNNKPKTMEQKTKSLLTPSSKPFTAAKQKLLEERRKTRRNNPTMPKINFGRSTSESSTDTIQELILQGIKTEDIYELFLGNNHDDSSSQQQQQQQQQTQQTQHEHQQYQPPVVVTPIATPTPTPTDTTPSYSRTGIAPLQNRLRYLLENEYPETECHYSPASFFGDSAFATQTIHID